MSGSWPSEKCCAVSLTYDDAFESQWGEVAPALEERGIRATFYTPIRPSLWNHAVEWQRLANAGHELGNHTVFHPCRRVPGSLEYEGYDRYDLSRYSLAEFQRELETANAYLRLLDGRTERTYGNTCHNVTVGRDEEEASIAPVLQQLFIAARGRRQDLGVSSDPSTLDLHEIGCGSSHSFELLRAGIEQAKKAGGWLVICLHDVAEKEERLRIARSEHIALLDYLARDSQIWVAPVVEVAQRIRAQRSPVPV